MPATEADPDFSCASDRLRWAVERLARHQIDDEAGPHPVGKPPPPLPDELPECGIGSEPALAQLATVALGGAARLGHPGFMAHMDPPTPWPTWVAALWAAALNQNLLHEDTAPTARGLERTVVEWLAPLFGMRGGHLVPGSTLANLTALWAARELRGIEQVVASEMAHLSVRKAAAMLGLGYHAVPADDLHRLSKEGLERVDLRRSALVLTAGTTIAGAVDDLRVEADPAWRHVDAAWAGPLRFSARHAELLEGIELADSVSVSSHKWLFQPKESAIVLFSEPSAAHEAMSFGGNYLANPNVGVLGSHGFAALPLAATLIAWGRAGVAARVDRCMEIAQELHDLIAGHNALEAWRQPVTGVVLWRPIGVDPNRVRQRLSGAFVSIADVRGEVWLRSVAANPNANPDLIVDRVLAAAPEPAGFRRGSRE